MTRFFLLTVMFCFISVAFGDETKPSDAKTEQPFSPAGLMPIMPDFTPPPTAFPPDRGFLTQMRQQLSFELQQTQRTIGMLGPNDTQLRATLESQQTTLTKQLKDIDTQLAGGTEAVQQTPMAPFPQMPEPPKSFGVIAPMQQPVNPWQPQPSKEITDLRGTVEALRQEIGELKSTVKALETQIQLLNRTILLSDQIKGK